MNESFDPQRGESAKQEGMARSWLAANPAYKVSFLECAREALRRRLWITTDHVIALMRDRANVPVTHEHRVNGPLMKEAEREGWCQWTDRTVKSNQSVCHRRDIRMWWSMLYEGPGPRRKPRWRPPPDPRQIDLDLSNQ
jgi:hypothetical protein